MVAGRRGIPQTKVGIRINEKVIIGLPLPLDQHRRAQITTGKGQHLFAGEESTGRFFHIRVER